MLDKTGKPYENLARAVLQFIVKRSDVSNTDVQHDVKLQGKYVKAHQIDICWRFTDGLKEYVTIVQAKDWKRPVNLGEVLKLRGVLDELPGQPTGIFISRSGYQRSAISAARSCGILIFELREIDCPPPLVITTTGWAKFWVVPVPLDGVIGTSVEEAKAQKPYPVDFHYQVFTPDFSKIHFDVSKSWLQTQDAATNETNLAELTLQSMILHEINLFDRDASAIGNVAKVFQQLAMAMNKEGIEQKRATHVFETETFIQTTSPVIPYVKVDAVSVNVKISHRLETRRGRNANFAQWVLHELNSGRTVWFAATRSVTSSLPDRRTSAAV